MVKSNIQIDFAKQAQHYAEQGQYGYAFATIGIGLVVNIGFVVLKYALYAVAVACGIRLAGMWGWF